ncbi:hypothetical protein PM082_010163 [Marasmius tenuissimus]|nr:hypothetical protein PM082_010163 [Marasmius tenuissimus]
MLPLRGQDLCLNNYFYSSIPRGVQQLWETLLSHMHRCESLYCFELGGEFAIPIDFLLNLTTLIDDSRNPIAERQIAYKNASRLTSVTTSFLYPLHDLPYHQLTSFECHDLRRGDVERLIRHVLPSCKNLESLTLKDIPDNIPGLSPSADKHPKPSKILHHILSTFSNTGYRFSHFRIDAVPLFPCSDDLAIDVVPRTS